MWGLLGWNSTVLNLGGDSKKGLEVKEGSSIAEAMNRSILKLFSKHISEDGKQVSYSEIRKDKEFEEYKATAKKLTYVDLSSLPYEEWICFLLNIYNSLVIHALVENGVPTTSYSRMRFYRVTSYRIGTENFSLDDIEHGLLRHNQKHPLPLVLKPQFWEGDPRLVAGMPSLDRKIDPRIHFALNCGARSCPPIRVYKPSNLERGLEMAAVGFVEDNVDIYEKERKIKLSKIFYYFSSDFGNTQEDVLRRISGWLSEEKRKKFNQLIASGVYTITYADYDWGLNGS